MVDAKACSNIYLKHRGTLDNRVGGKPSDKGKPIVRWGRKATVLRRFVLSREIAGSSKECRAAEMAVRYFILVHIKAI